MPYTISDMTLPGGARCLRAVGAGVISREDAEYLLSFVGEKGSAFMVPYLLNTEQVKTISMEARSLFAEGLRAGSVRPWCGMVATSPIVRVTTNFFLRVNGNPKVKMFSSEADAIRWLDERTREDASAASPATLDRAGTAVTGGPAGSNPGRPSRARLAIARG